MSWNYENPYSSTPFEHSPSPFAQLGQPYEVSGTFGTLRNAASLLIPPRSLVSLLPVLVTHSLLVRDRRVTRCSKEADP